MYCPSPLHKELLVYPVSYTHLRAHETGRNLVCRLLLEKKGAIFAGKIDDLLPCAAEPRISIRCHNYSNFRLNQLCGVPSSSTTAVLPWQSCRGRVPSCPWACPPTIRRPSAWPRWWSRPSGSSARRPTQHRNRTQLCTRLKQRRKYSTRGLFANPIQGFCYGYRLSKKKWPSYTHTYSWKVNKLKPKQINKQFLM